MGNRPNVHPSICKVLQHLGSFVDAWTEEGLERARNRAGFITAPLNGKCPLVGKVQVCPSIHGIQIPLARTEECHDCTTPVGCRLITRLPLPYKIGSPAWTDAVRKSRWDLFPCLVLACSLDDTPAKDKVGKVGGERVLCQILKFRPADLTRAPGAPPRGNLTGRCSPSWHPRGRVSWGKGVGNGSHFVLNALRELSGEDEDRARAEFTTKTTSQIQSLEGPRIIRPTSFEPVVGSWPSAKTATASSTV